MRNRQIQVLVLALLLVGTLALILQRQRQRAWQQGAGSMGEKVLPELDVNAVNGITITAADASLTLQRRDGRWRVSQRYGYNADFSKVRDLLLKIDDLKIVQPVLAGPDHYARLQLLTPEQGAADTGMRLSFATVDDAEHSILLGRQHMRKTEMGEWPDGRYLLLTGRDPAKVVLVSETFSNINLSPTTWLDNEFVKIANIKHASLWRDGQQQWQLQAKSEGDGLVLADLADDETADDAKLRDINTAFSWIRFADIVDPATDPDELGLDNPAVYRAVDADYIAYNVSIGTINAAGQYPVQIAVEYVGPEQRQSDPEATADDQQQRDQEFAASLAKARAMVQTLQDRLDSWVYLVNRSALDKILVGRDALLKPPPAVEYE